MKFSYSRIVLGLTFELIDFRIMNFDLLPDVVGYLLVMWGAYRLSGGNRVFLIAWLAAAVQLLPACGELFGHRIEVPLLGSETFKTPQLAEAALKTLVEAAMLAGICAGIRASAAKRGLRGLAEAARTRWRIVVVMDGALLLLLPFLLNTTKNSWEFFFLLLAVAAFLAHFSIVFLVNRAGREGHDDSEEASGPGQQ
ncbi:hypothetical protein [Paenibacillus glycinis]|uniref:Uncharacterized protein n=1 Tax=Paenibacillus glycinis TaxID=2697035 RepID=A0ABW9XN29_9BACL|nr:hypothetical protein [Paenibacillus glycinis]NBD23846.1 hypothetical protein [Paenibacillus glycinis]